VREEMLELKREEFDAYLVRFQMDIQDHTDLGKPLQDDLLWSPGGPIGGMSLERRAFDEDCVRWEKHNRRRRLRHRKSRLSTTSHDRHTNTTNPSMIALDAGEPSRSDYIPNHRRVCRSLRVFIAWKP